MTSTEWVFRHGQRASWQFPDEGVPQAPLRVVQIDPAVRDAGLLEELRASRSQGIGVEPLTFTMFGRGTAYPARTANPERTT